MSMYHFHDDYSAFGFLGAFHMILWWVLVIVGIIAVARWMGDTQRSRLESSALEILKERYAKGEISKEEFREKKEDLSKN